MDKKITITLMKKVIPIVEWKDIPSFPGYEASTNSMIRNKNSGKIVKQHINGSGYYTAHLRINGKDNVYKAHRLFALAFIPNPYNLPIVDHIDRNELNNRIANLRWATISQNNCNQKLKKNNTSGYRGVSLYKANTWASNIRKDTKRVFLGYSTTPEEAARVYDAKARALHGEFVQLNFP